MKGSRFLLLFLPLFSAISFLSSCLSPNDTNNYQTFNGLIGTVVSDQNKKLFCVDQDGSYLYDPQLSTYKDGDRLVVSAKISSSNQIVGAYYLIAELNGIQLFNVKNTFSFDTVEKDTFKNDPIYNYSLSYINYSNKKFYFTTLLNYNASNLYHSFDFVNNRTKINGDTLKFEVRHNKKGDTEQTVFASTLISFDMTPFLDTIPSGKLKVIQVSYKLNSTVSKQFIPFKRQ